MTLNRYRLESNWKHGRCTTSTFNGHNGIVTCLHFQEDTLVTGCSDRYAKTVNNNFLKQKKTTKY